MQGLHSYALEKLEAAVRALAIGPGDVRSRLWDAFMVFNPLKEAHFPDNLKSDYRWVMSQLTKYGPEGEGKRKKGSVQVSLSRMRNSTGVEIAKRLLYLRDRLREGVE